MGFSAADFHLEIQPCASLQVAGIPAHGRRKTQVVEVRRAQVGDQALQFGERVGGKRFEMPQGGDRLFGVAS